MKALVLSADWKPKPGYEVTPEQEDARLGQGNLVWHNPTMSVGERPAPAITGDHDVLIRNRACGVCGSDIHMYVPDADGYLDLPAKARTPIAIGHEYSGEVVEVGAAVTRVKPGDLVAVEAQVNCGKCRPCLRGLASNCQFITDRGYALDGGMATHSVAHERNCWPLTAVAERYGADRAYDVGALTEPTAVVYNGMVNRAGGFTPGDTVAVFGCGPIGLAAVGLAGALGAGSVLAVELAAAKRDLATQLGATATFDPAGGDTARWLLEQTGGVGVDMAVDATGAGRIVLPSILSGLAIGGKIVSIGANMRPIDLDTLPLMFRSASMFFTLGHLGGGFPAVIALHAAGRLDLTPMITARFDLDDGVAAMERAAKGEDAKVLLYPNGRNAS
jgi:threonine dehydrogenase-like Zn-dependent dehydrogenase